MSELEPPTARGHHLLTSPIETAAGWIVECSCGWTNRAAPAEDPDAAIRQFEVHQE